MKKIFIFILILELTSCGGGTSGTSQTGVRTQKTYAGSVSDEQGQPVEDVSIQIENDNAKTNKDGTFVLAANLGTENNEITINSNLISKTLTLPKFSNPVSIVQLNIKISEQEVKLSDVEFVLDNISGKGCENAFAETEIFRLDQDSAPLLISNQVSPVAAKTKCFANVSLFSNASPVAGVGAEMYFFSTPNDITTSISVVLVDTQNTNVDGKVVFEFIPKLPSRGPGYFVIEAPSIQPLSSRVAVVINTLLKE